MPIVNCTHEGSPGYRWGDDGEPHTYDPTDPTSRTKALKRAQDDMVVAAPGPVPGRFTKTDDELQIVWGEVYVPNYPDTDGDFMTPEGIRDMAYKFMTNGLLHKVDVQHDNKLYGCHIVESFVARKDDPDFIAGSWVVATHVPSPEIWAKVKSGELNGYSMEAFAVPKKTVLTVEVAPVIKGETSDTNEHTHKFKVGFDVEDGSFLGGETSPAEDGHWHPILRGTITEPAGDPPHVHKFSYVEDVVGAED